MSVPFDQLSNLELQNMYQDYNRLKYINQSLENDINIMKQECANYKNWCEMLLMSIKHIIYNGIPQTNS